MKQCSKLETITSYNFYQFQYQTYQFHIKNIRRSWQNVLSLFCWLWPKVKCTTDANDLQKKQSVGLELDKDSHKSLDSISSNYYSIAKIIWHHFRLLYHIIGYATISEDKYHIVSLDMVWYHLTWHAINHGRGSDVAGAGVAMTAAETTWPLTSRRTWRRMWAQGRIFWSYSISLSGSVGAVLGVWPVLLCSRHWPLLHL